VKRRDLIRHLESQGCEFLREGGNHTVYLNRAARKVSTVPRHREIFDDLAPVFFEEIVELARIEPDSPAFRAAIELDSAHREMRQLASALRTLHMTGISSIGSLCIH
jgi:mRNA interferase HicA